MFEEIEFYFELWEPSDILFMRRRFEKQENNIIIRSVNLCTTIFYYCRVLSEVNVSYNYIKIYFKVSLWIYEIMKTNLLCISLLIEYKTFIIYILLVNL